MTKLSEVSKRDIVDLFGTGITIPGKSKAKFISWHGRLDDVAFLKRLYNLKNMESYDHRFNNAEDDITCHVTFQDYETNWIFSDNRFQIMDGNDEEFLGFICEVFHPAVTKHSIENEGYPEYYYFQEIKKFCYLRDMSYMKVIGKAISR